ncbi:gamma-glutamyltransferase [Robertkochia solimangrovi]|uniref:gamma-glutamyltransferase n=1 Tax=Robertkochia solimangrovi TaxID=2213046 RepID=UPI00118096A2|nr:gamma-glutamyltransferase [Robertkochia solimangrovi]TRZ45305.1 gamma-glutamyltransferase [Robertkochia solimangrovi]
MKRIYTLLLSCLLFIACDKPEKGLITEKAMVVSAREEASSIGAAIMKQGGNAFDAMVATHLALAVAHPSAGNIGGGGFMVYRTANGETGSLDFREKAPLTAHRDMYLDSVGDVIENMSRLGAPAVGVPGSVAGVLEIYEKFCSLPLKDLINPAIELARKGVVVTEKQARALNGYHDLFIEVNGDSSLFSNDYAQKDLIIYENLAQTLEAIRDHGRDGFYTGSNAEKLAGFIQKNGGFVTVEDLAAYQAVWRPVSRINFNDLTIYSMAPPSSGGITMGQILGMVTGYDLESLGHNQQPYMQLITEAERRAYADRNYFLGDPDFVNIPKETLLDMTYLKDRMASFSFEKPTPSSEIAHGNAVYAESMETTHYSIVDAEGNAVSVTTTLNGSFGSKLYCDELGFFLNNEMDDFSVKPGVPNMFGLTGNEANSIAPGKRMLSSMTPSIAEKDGKLFMVVGTPGGATIITSVLQTILNVDIFNMGMQEAVNAPRFHHQWLPDLITIEKDGFDNETISGLKEIGYTIKETRSIGRVDAILILENGKLEGGADPRGDDAASGF